MSTARLEESALTHGGSKVVTNPEVGKFSTSKQTLMLRSEFERVRFTLALSPTLIVIEGGVTVRVGSDCWILMVVAFVG